MTNFTVSIADESKVQQILDLLNGFSCVKVSETEKEEQTLDERLSAAIKKSKPKKIDVGFDENGNILIDKSLHPRLYDWAVNG